MSGYLLSAYQLGQVRLLITRETLRCTLKFG